VCWQKVQGLNTKEKNERNTVHEEEKTANKEITHEQKNRSALTILDTGGRESAQRARRSRRFRVGSKHHAQ
jgi:hypothetical protein